MSSFPLLLYIFFVMRMLLCIVKGGLINLVHTLG